VSDLVKVRGDWHPEVLANGLTMAPGEPFERTMLTDEDRRLLDEGLIIDAIVTPVPLEGEALQDRAKALNVKGRTGMTADELREAVALEEAKRGTATTAVDQTQRIGA
jgi:hypothetical protein